MARLCKDAALRRRAFQDGFARRLRMAMAVDDVNAYQLSMAAFGNRTQVYTYMHGDSMPSAMAAQRLAYCLGVSADWLLGLKQGDHRAVGE